MRQYFGDPEDCADMKERDDAKRECDYPVCCICGEHITDGHYYEDDYGIFCTDHWDEHVAEEYKKSAEDYAYRKENE